MEGADVDSRADLWGWEWDFLAVDPVGHVAVLSSAGYGPIPAHVLEVRDAVERAVAIINSMPATRRSVHNHHRRDGDYSDWYASSARGFYTYDWHHHHGPYELISSPAEPLIIATLPAAVRSAASILTIPHPFAGLATLTLP